jgi:hypothetical protein
MNNQAIRSAINPMVVEIRLAPDLVVLLFLPPVSYWSCRLSGHARCNISPLSQTDQ